MNRQLTSCAILIVALVQSASFAADAATPEPSTVPSAKPNIIVILADDLGYGDVNCYGAKTEHLKTPNIDRLAAEGIRFTDGHSASSVCTPSRCSLLTGDYAYRHPRGSGILPGNAPLFIDTHVFTLPGMFKAKGYATGFVGKWHLGLGAVGGTIDWNGEIKPGPNEIGFDEAFFIPATGDRVPTVFVRNHKVENLDPKDPITVSYKGRIGNEPTGISHPELATVLLGKKNEGHLDAITKGVSRIGFMTGGTSALWTDQDISDTLLSETVHFLEKSKEKPFFLYLATHGIHEPRIPHPRFAGKSGAGTYGDHILELDDLVGQLLAQLKRLNLDDNTLIVFSSDNGGSTEGGNGRYDYGARGNRQGHLICGMLRGGKGNVFEGGTRVPFIVRWPAQVPAGKVSPALVSQTDLVASFARLLDTRLPENAARDSVDVLDALLGKSDSGRQELLEHPMGGFHGSALRQGNWKFINGQLYDLSNDLSEKKNLAKEQPDRVKTMATRLKELQSATPVALARPTAAQVAWQDLDLGILFCYDAYVYEDGRVEYPNPAKVLADPNAYANMQNPVKFNTDQWLEVAKSMGANHAIFTAKHWLSFCHWQSDANPYSMKILKWRNGKGDMVKEFTDSCRKYGLAAGLFTEASEDVRLSVHKYKVTKNSPLSQAEYDRMVTGELEELCTQYGPLCEIWYDMREGPYTAPFRAIMNKHQPGAVFYGPDYRWGGGSEDGQVNYPCWATADANTWDPKLLRNGDVTSTNWRPARADAPLRGSKGVHDWYWHPNREHGVDSLEKLQKMYYNCVGRNAKLIIGLTPDRDGLIPAPDAARCKEFGVWLEKTFSGKPLAETSGNRRDFTLEIPADITTPVAHIVLQEDIRHGERVRTFTVEEALADGTWKQLCAGSCIGHKFIAPVSSTARKFRLHITESIGDPQIRSFQIR